MMAQTFSPLARATVGICVIDAEGKAQALRDEELERITARAPALSSPEDSGSEEDEYEDATGSFSPVGLASDPKTMRARIIKQVDFYFGNNNYPKDKFIRKHTRADPDGWIPLTVVSIYKKMKKLSQDVPVLAEALLDSAMVEVSADGLKVRRKNPPARTPESIVASTVVVDNLRDTTTEQDVRDLFEPASVKIMNFWFFHPQQSTLPEPLASLCPVEDLHPALTTASTERCAIVELEYPDEALKCIRILNRGQDWRVALHVGAANRQHNPPESRCASGRNTPSNFDADGKQRRRRGNSRGAESPNLSRSNTPSNLSLSRSGSSSPMIVAHEEGTRQRCVSLDTARGRAMKESLGTKTAASPLSSHVATTSPNTHHQQQQQQQQQQHQQQSPVGTTSGTPESRSRSSTLDSDWRHTHMKQSPLSRLQNTSSAAASERQSRSADSSPLMQRRPLTLSPPTHGAPGRSLTGGSGLSGVNSSPGSIGGRMSPNPAFGGHADESGSARASPRAFSPMPRSDECVLRQPNGPTPSLGFSRGRGKPLPL